MPGPLGRLCVLGAADHPVLLAGAARGRRGGDDRRGGDSSDGSNPGSPRGPATAPPPPYYAAPPPPAPVYAPAPAPVAAPPAPAPVAPSPQAQPSSPKALLLNPKEIKKWDAKTVQQFLETIHMPDAVIEKFADMGVTGDDLMECTADDLQKDLDIGKLQARKIIRSLGLTEEDAK